jgi:predicted RNase H-like HicB family nuclease
MGNRAESNTFRIEWSQEIGAYVARCLELPGLDVSGKTREAALRGMKITVEELLEWPIDAEQFVSGHWD